MNKKFVKVVSAVALATTLAACGKTKTVKEEWTDAEKIQWATENGYVKVEAENTLPKLEVSFSETYTQMNANIVNQKIQRKETFVFFWGSTECGSCATFKPVVNQFVKSTGYAFYYMEEDAADNTDVNLKALKVSLGYNENDAMTTPTVFVIVNGEMKKQVINPTWATGEEIVAALDDYYNLDEAGDFATESRKDLKTLEDLAVAVASKEKFILLTSRYACPHCNRLADPNRDNVVTKIAKLWEGKFYKLTSENVAATIDMTKVDTTSETSIFKGLNDVRVAELTTYILTTGEIAPEDLGVTFSGTSHTFNADTLYAALAAYSNSERGRQFAAGRMLNDIKFVPTFEAVNFSANVGVATKADESKVVVFENVIAQTIVQEGGNITPTWAIDENGNAYATYGKTGEAEALDEIASLRYAYFAKMLNGATSPTDGMGNTGTFSGTGLLNNEYSVERQWNKIANWLMSWAPQLEEGYVAKYYDISASAEYTAAQVELTSYDYNEAE